MSIPYYIISSDSEDETTIPLSNIEPSFHTPQSGYPASDYEFETTPTNDPMVEEEEEDEEIAPEPVYQNFHPSQYYSGGPRTIRTARKRVHPPHMAFASTSTSVPPSTHASTSQVVYPTVTSPTPPIIPSFVPVSEAPVAPIPPPTSVFQVPTEATSPPYSPLEHYTPSSPPPFPSPLAHPYVPATAEDIAWIMHQEGYPPMNFGTFTVTAPPPPTYEDPTVSILVDQISDHEIRLDNLEADVEVLAGPVHIEELQQEVYSLDHRVQQIDDLTQELATRVPPPGDIVTNTIVPRLGQVENTVDSLQAQVQAMQQMISDIYRGQ